MVVKQLATALRAFFVMGSCATSCSLCRKEQHPVQNAALLFAAPV